MTLSLSTCGKRRLGSARIPVVETRDRDAPYDSTGDREPGGLV